MVFLRLNDRYGRLSQRKAIVVAFVSGSLLLFSGLLIVGLRSFLLAFAQRHCYSSLPIPPFHSSLSYFPCLALAFARELALHLEASSDSPMVFSVSAVSQALEAIHIMNAPLTTTFGIEIEFIVAYNQADYAHKLFLESRRLWEDNPGCIHGCKFRPHIISHMIDVLREAGFSVNDLYCYNDYSNWSVDTDGSTDAMPEYPLDPEFEGLHFYGMELKTPVFFFSQVTPALCQIEKMLNTLQRNFKVFTNDTCGLHVHVGNREVGFPLDTLKSFAKLVTAFENQLSSVHPDHRIYNLHCRAPGANFPGRDPLEKIAIINDADSTETLVGCMSSCRNGDSGGFAYNFTNLAINHEINTIEFRQHEATLEVRAMGAWTILVCGLIQKCHGTDKEEISKFIHRHIDNETYTLIDLLDDLGFGEIASFYLQRDLYDHREPTYIMHETDEDQSEDEELANNMERMFARLDAIVNGPGILSGL